MSQTIKYPASENLEAIINNPESSTSEKIDAILRHGLETFHLDLAIISEINEENQQYTVIHCQSTDGSLKQGTIFDLGVTYCNITLKFPIPVAIANMGASEHNRHPGYTVFQLESYIGCRIQYGDKHGTINFSGAKPRESFTSDDRQLIQKTATLMSGLL